MSLGNIKRNRLLQLVWSKRTIHLWNRPESNRSSKRSVHSNSLFHAGYTFNLSSATDKCELYFEWCSNRTCLLTHSQGKSKCTAHRAYAESGGTTPQLHFGIIAAPVTTVTYKILLWVLYTARMEKTKNTLWLCLQRKHPLGSSKWSWEDKH